MCLQFDVAAVAVVVVLMPMSLSMLMAESKRVNTLGALTLAACSSALGIFEPYRLNAPHVTDQGLLRSIVPPPIAQEVDTRRPVSHNVRVLRHSPTASTSPIPRRLPAQSLSVLLVAQPFTGFDTMVKAADHFASLTCSWNSTPCFTWINGASELHRNSFQRSRLATPQMITSEQASHKILHGIAKHSGGYVRGAVLTRDPRDFRVCNASTVSRRELAEAVRLADENNGLAKYLTLVRVEELAHEPQQTCSSMATAFGFDSSTTAAWEHACQAAVKHTSSPSADGAEADSSVSLHSKARSRLCWGVTDPPEHSHSPSELATRLAHGLGYEE